MPTPVSVMVLHTTVTPVVPVVEDLGGMLVIIVSFFVMGRVTVMFGGGVVNTPSGKRTLPTVVVAVLVAPVLQHVVETILSPLALDRVVQVETGVVQRRTLVGILVEGRSARLAMSVMLQPPLQLQQVFP